MPLDDGHIGNIMDALETALGVDMTDFDFSGGNKVRRGRYVIKPNAYFIQIANPSFEVEQGPPMQAFVQRCSVDIVASVPGNARTEDGYARTALALANRVVEAIETAKVTPGNALHGNGLREFGMQSVTLDPEIDGIPSGMAVAWVILTFAYRRPDKQTGL